jgi:hypothetical protein
MPEIQDVQDLKAEQAAAVTAEAAGGGAQNQNADESGGGLFLPLPAFGRASDQIKYRARETSG